MYRVSLYVTLPGRRGLDSPRLEQRVLPTSSEHDRLHRDRQTLFGMLTVDHDVGGPPLDTELLLTARQSVETSANATNVEDETGVTINYTVQPAYTGGNTDTKDTELAVLYSPGGVSAAVTINKVVFYRYGNN